VAIIFTVNPSIGPTIFERGLSRIFTPMQRGMSGAVSWVSGNFTAVADNQRLLQEIEALREERNILLEANYRLQLAGEENERLSALLDINQRYAPLSMMGARIIGHNPNDWYSRFFLDRGSNDGVTTNMAVLGDGGGLIGVIRQVHPRRSQFVSIVDNDFSASVMSRRTGDIGTARGDIALMQQGLIRMDRIDARAQIMPGDEIITSTHSAIFPPGILVGTVVSIHPNPDGHTRHAIVSPAANLDNITMVSIITENFGDTDVRQDWHTFVLED